MPVLPACSRPCLIPYSQSEDKEEKASSPDQGQPPSAAHRILSPQALGSLTRHLQTRTGVCLHWTLRDGLKGAGGVCAEQAPARSSVNIPLAGDLQQTAAFPLLVKEGLRMLSARTHHTPPELGGSEQEESAG